MIKGEFTFCTLEGCATISTKGNAIRTDRLADHRTLAHGIVGIIGRVTAIAPVRDARSFVARGSRR